MSLLSRVPVWFFCSVCVYKCTYIYMHQQVSLQICYLYWACFDLELHCCCTGLLWVSEDKPIHNGHRQGGGEVFPIGAEEAKVRIIGTRMQDKLRVWKLRGALSLRWSSPNHHLASGDEWGAWQLPSYSLLDNGYVSIKNSVNLQWLEDFLGCGKLQC